MSSTKAQVGVGIVSAGVLGGMGYEIYALTNNKGSIKNYLKKVVFEIIEENNNSF